MSIEQYIRESIKCFLEDGQVENNLQNTEGNTQNGFLDMESYKSFELGIPKNPKHQFMVLDFEVHPLFLKDIMPDYSFLYSVVGLGRHPTLFSAVPGSIPSFCVSKIQLRCLGKGYYQDVNALETGFGESLEITEDINFTIPFSIPPGGGFDLRVEAQPNGSAAYSCDMWEGSRLQEKPLIPFGGYLDPILDFAKVVPMLGTLRGGAQTNVGIKSVNFWVSRGLSNTAPALEGDHRYSVVGEGEDIFKSSLAQQIQQGVFKISLQGHDYESREYSVLDPFNRRIQMSFIAVD